MRHAPLQVHPSLGNSSLRWHSFRVLRCSTPVCSINILAASELFFVVVPRMDFLLHACDVAKREACGHWYLGLFTGAVFALITTDISLALWPRYRRTPGLCPSLGTDSYPAYQPGLGKY